MSDLPNLTVVDHPLIRHKLALLRSVDTPTKLFRELVEEITMLMAYEVTRTLEEEEVEVVTPLETMTGQRISLGIVNYARTRAFEIPPSLFMGGEEFQIKIYPLYMPGRFNYMRPEGSGIKTPPIAVKAGDRIELILRSDLNQSTMAVVPS